MQIIGLTGGIGAGKSAVAARMAERGAVVIDVDAIGREVLDGAAAADVVERFGEQVVGDDGRIDRARLAKVVFSDREALAALENISHPAINVEIDRRLDAMHDDTLVVLDMAVLVGSRLGRDLPSGRGYDTVVVVDASEEVRMARLVDIRGMSEADARARTAAQPRDADRHAVADHIVVNDGDLDALDAAVDALMVALA